VRVIWHRGKGSDRAHERRRRKDLEVWRHGQRARNGRRVRKAEQRRPDRRSILAEERHTHALSCVSIGVSSRVVEVGVPTWRRAILLYSLPLIALRDCLS
jgi:hypothetical protein